MAYIYLEEAANMVGRWKFGDDWTGEELQPTAHADSLTRRKAVEKDLKEVIRSGNAKAYIEDASMEIYELSPQSALHSNFFVDVEKGVVGDTRDPTTWDPCRFNRSELMSSLRRGRRDATTTPTRRRPGNPGKYDWELIENFMRVWIRKNGGIPDPRSTLVEAVQSWYSVKIDGNNQPSAPPIYQRISKIAKEINSVS